MRDQQSVYFVQAGDSNGPIKIGYSSDVAKRVASLRTGNHLPITLLVEFKHANAPALEKRLHEMFAADRLEGEWFNPSPDLVRFIQAVDVQNSSAIGVLSPESHNVPFHLLCDIRESPVRAELGKLWVVEWSERSGHTHVTSLLESLSMFHAAHLFGETRPTDYQIVAIVDSADAAEELASKLEPWLKSMRAVRLISEIAGL